MCIQYNMLRIISVEKKYIGKCCFFFLIGHFLCIGYVYIFILSVSHNSFLFSLITREPSLMLGSNGHKMSHYISKDYSGSPVSCWLSQLINTVFLVLVRLNIFSNPDCHNNSVFPTRRILKAMVVFMLLHVEAHFYASRFPNNNHERTSINIHESSLSRLCPSSSFF